MDIVSQVDGAVEEEMGEGADSKTHCHLLYHSVLQKRLDAPSADCKPKPVRANVRKRKRVTRRASSQAPAITASTSAASTSAASTSAASTSAAHLQGSLEGGN